MSTDVKHLLLEGDRLSSQRLFDAARTLYLEALGQAYQAYEQHPEQHVQLHVLCACHARLGSLAHQQGA